MTSPSMNDTNPISLCQAFKAAIPAALTAFCEMRKKQIPYLLERTLHMNNH